MGYPPRFLIQVCLHFFTGDWAGTGVGVVGTLADGRGATPEPGAVAGIAAPGNAGTTGLGETKTGFIGGIMVVCRGTTNTGTPPEFLGANPVGLPRNVPAGLTGDGPEGATGVGPAGLIGVTPPGRVGAIPAGFTGVLATAFGSVTPRGCIGIGPLEVMGVMLAGFISAPPAGPTGLA
jgi:hypothetical protein